MMKLAGREDIAVRAAVRDPQSVAMAADNVTPVKFVYEDRASMRAACAGVDAVFWVTPVAENQVELAAAFVEEAKAAKVPYIVKLSAVGMDAAKPMSVARWHLEMEAGLKAAGIPFTSLRPSGFMQNFLGNSAPLPDGNMYAPMSDAKVAYIDVRDIADVAVRCLTETGHAGKTYYLYGPEAITMSQVAATLSEVTGRQIRYVDVPQEAAKRAMAGANMPGWLVDMVAEIQTHAREGHSAKVNSTVRELARHSGTTFRDFARDHAKAWKS